MQGIPPRGPSFYLLRLTSFIPQVMGKQDPPLWLVRSGQEPGFRLATNVLRLFDVHANASRFTTDISTGNNQML